MAARHVWPQRCRAQQRRGAGRGSSWRAHSGARKALSDTDHGDACLGWRFSALAQKNAMSMIPQNTDHKQTVDYLKRHGIVVTTAESCTAGLIASRLASTPGAGEVLDCAFVVYDPKAKRRCLGVPEDVLANNNLTSEAVALEMARGALRHSDASLAIANTGVADDSDPAIEPGTQCYAWVFRDEEGVREFTETRVFEGERNRIREDSADHALSRVVHYHAGHRAQISQADTQGEPRE